MRKAHFVGILVYKDNITTTANFATSFLIFQKKKGMILHENRLQGDDSHEITCLI